MRAMLRQITYTAASLVAVYLVMMALSLVLVPRPHVDGGLDSNGAPHTLYVTNPKYVFLARGPVASEAPKLIVLGASNAAVGFKQKEVQSAVRGAVVHGLAVHGANITEVRQVYGLVDELQDAKARATTIYVIGIWGGMFTENHFRWFTPERHGGDTDIDIERYRYLFWWHGAHGPVRLVPPGSLDLAVLLIHPYLAIDRLTRDVSAGFTARFGHDPHAMTNAMRDAMVFDQPQREAALRYWNEYTGHTGPLPVEQFDELRGLIGDMLNGGSKVIVADLALPPWLSRAMPQLQGYAESRDAALRPYRDHPGFRFLEMEGMNGDDDFYDEVHPKPKVTQRWADALAATAAPLLGTGTTASDPEATTPP